MELNFVEARIVEAVTDIGEEGIKDLKELNGRSVKDEGAWKCFVGTAIIKVKGRALSLLHGSGLRQFCGHRFTKTL